MTNPSPYDSGHDSSYSNASGPGNPPSSCGNSDLDDQVDRYIRDQRVATLISTNPATTQSRLPQSHSTQQRDRNIALFHRLIANLPSHITIDPELFETARAYLSDIAHSNQAPDITAQPIHTTPTYSDDPDIDPVPPLVQDSSDDDANSDDEPPPTHNTDRRRAQHTDPPTQLPHTTDTQRTSQPPTLRHTNRHAHL